MVGRDVTAVRSEVQRYASEHPICPGGAGRDSVEGWINKHRWSMFGAAEAVRKPSNWWPSTKPAV
jgi:hypothetical protein